MGFAKFGYQLVGSPTQSETGDDVLGGPGARFPRFHRLRQRISSNVAFYGNICFFFISLTLFIAAVRRTPSEMECAKITSPYSSIWDAVEFWEGDFVNYFNHSTIYRGPPTYEREVAWNDLWHYGVIPVDTAGVAALKKTDQAKFVAINGSDPKNPQYGGVVEVFHQLHCLNLIRQATWPLNYFDKSWGFVYPWDLEHKLGGRMHVDHCIETLRLSLMCYSDITPLLIQYDDTRKIGRKSDFNVHHKCRNFTKIVEKVAGMDLHVPWAPGTGPDDDNHPDTHNETNKEHH